VDDDQAILDLVLGKLEAVRQEGGQWKARCPAHADARASLAIRRGTEQPVIFYCHAHCERDAILDALGLTLADVSKPREESHEEWTPAGPAIAVYDYTDEHGKLLFQVCRTADKQFPQRVPDPLARSGWRWKLGKTRRVPYHLPQLLAAVRAGKHIYIAEGEKDVHAIERAGGVATTSPGGAGKWRGEYSAYFEGADVTVIADRDGPGRKHATAVARALRGVAGTVLVLEPLTGKDAYDHLTAGHALADFTLGGEPPPVVSLNGMPRGAELLDLVHEFLGRFIAYPSEDAHVAHTLWCAHAHIMDAWESTPRIAFLSPEPGSGKTRALEVTELLVPRAVEAINATPAYLFRKVSDPEGLPTILYDEVDTIFGPRTAKDNEEIRGMLNAGHRRGAMAGRCVIKGKNIETEELPAYCAVALAGLGDVPDTLLSRAVVIRMRRRSPGETVEPYRRRVHKDEGARLRAALGAWGAQVQGTLTDSWPEMPDGIADRDADVWEALLSVAEEAGSPWPERAHVAAVALVAASKVAPPSLGVRLLADLREVFGDAGSMSTDAILTALREMDEAPWADLKGKPLNPRGLASYLRKYGVRSGNVRIGESVFKGYQRTDLHDPWLRYLPTSRESISNTRESVDTPDIGTATSATCASCGKPPDPALAVAGETTHPMCWPEGSLGEPAPEGPP
jgi:Protein of unknown function (DUF3631)